MKANLNGLQVTKFGNTEPVFTKYFAPIYSAFSGEHNPATVSCDEKLNQYIRNLYVKVNQPAPTFINKPLGIPAININNPNELLIAFSGGKDGVAVAIKVMENGLKPVLYHLYGINRTYMHEVKHAEAIAKRMGIKLVVEQIRLTGKIFYPDHPFKNQFIFCNMVDYGIAHNINQFAIGNHMQGSLEGCDVRIEFSDMNEQINLFDDFLRHYIPHYKRDNWLVNNKRSVETVRDYDPKLINMVSSCVSAPYRKPMMRQHMIKRFGDKVLMDGRCGGYCYKCTSEYLWMVEWGLLPRVEGMVEWCQNWIKTHPMEVGTYYES